MLLADDVIICLEFGGSGWSLYRTSRYLIESFYNIKVLYKQLIPIPTCISCD